MKNFLVFVLAVLLGGALFFGVLRARRELAPVSTGAPAPVASPDDGADAARSDEPARPAKTPAPARKVPEAKLETRPAKLPSELSGSVVVLDEQGGEHARESGFLALGVGASGARTLHEIEVRDGRWSLSLGAEPAAGTSLVLRACALGGKAARLATDQAAELALPADGKVDLRFGWSPGPRLHVRARDTGAELADVALIELPLAQRGSTLDTLHPGPSAKTQARAAGASPLWLEPAGAALDTRVFFAKAPGYAWGRVEVHPFAGDELTLELERAGTIELEVVCDPSYAALEVLLVDAAPPHAEVLVLRRGNAKSFVLEDLRAGRYLAQARHYGLLTGSIEVVVAAGARTKAVLEVDSAPSGPVPLEGVLVVPEAWALDDFILEFLLQGRFDDGSMTVGSFEIRRSEMTPEAGSRERYRWSAPAAPGARAARYRVSLFPTSFVTELDTGPSGTKEALVTVPPPGVVAGRLLDEATGAAPAGEKVFFSLLTPRAIPSRSVSNPSAFELRVPQGEVLIFTKASLYEPCARLIDVGPGKNEVLLPARKKP